MANKWYHVAFVYDYSTSTQLLYLNGFLENSRTALPYEGTSGAITIGSQSGLAYFFNGYIDQVSLVTEAKTASEVLYSATVVCYYSFDSASFLISDVSMMAYHLHRVIHILSLVE
jgi:hypothetical protein